jgi:lipid II:glycine glycyltransferase (peptidoglycan interpeptide bridge formation enzyme)
MTKYKICFLSPEKYSLWDKFVGTSPMGTIFHTTFWLETVSPENWRVLGCFQGDKLIAGMPLIEKKRFGIRYISHPPLTPWMGIVIQSWDKNIKQGRKITLEKEISKQFIKWIKKADYFVQSFHPNYRDCQPMMWENFSCEPCYTYIISPLHDIDKIWSSLRENHRRNIRDANNKGFFIRKDINENEFQDIINKIFMQKAKELGCNESLFIKVHQRLKHSGRGTPFVIYDKENTIVAATYIVWDEQSAYYLLGGTNKEASIRSGMAMTLLMWEVIKEMAQKVDCFDFEGSDIPGVERFIRGFGGEQICYFRISYIGSRRLAFYICLKKLASIFKK